MRVWILSLILVGCGIFTEKAFSSVPIIFSGDSNQTNTPVQLTLNQPVEFQITSNTSNGVYLFFFIQNAQASDQSGPAGISPFSSTVTYSINGTGSYQIGGWIDGGSGNPAVSKRDSYLWMQLAQNISVGDKIAFTAGTLGGIAGDTNFNVPLSGSFTTFLVRSNDGSIISGSGSAVPEPSALSLLVVGLGGVMLLRRKRQKS